jgi:hypothetical protein
MQDKFLVKDNSHLIVLRPGPTLEESFSESYRQKAKEQIVQLRDQLYSQNWPALPNIQRQAEPF